MNRLLMTDMTADGECGFGSQSCSPQGCYAVASFCEYDRKRVLPVINELNSRGCRLYFDGLIRDTDSISQAHARNILKSMGILAFVSEASLCSRKFRQEVNFALSSEKTVIAVFLEDVIMSAGMEMQFSAVHCIHKDGYSDEEFFNRLTETALIEICCDK